MIMTQEAKMPDTEEAKIMIKNFINENNIEFVHLYLFLQDYDIVCVPQDEYDNLELK